LSREYSYYGIMERRRLVGQAHDISREGNSNYVAKKIALTSSGRSDVIVEDVIIHE
jgi:hypothetical protein